MKIQFRILVLFVVFTSLIFSVNFNADFKNERSYLDPSEPYHFNAGSIRIEPDMTCTVVSSVIPSPVLQGSLCNGDSIVCPGTTIRVTPTHNSKWALSNPSIYSFYSSLNRCDMEPYSSYNTNLNLKWLSDSVYAKYDVDSGGFASGDFALYYEDPYTGKQLYEELGTFYTESVTYAAVPYRADDPCSGPQYNKKGEGNIFCNGKIEILKDGSNVLSPQDLGQALAT